MPTPTPTEGHTSARWRNGSRRRDPRTRAGAVSEIPRGKRGVRSRVTCAALALPSDALPIWGPRSEDVDPSRRLAPRRHAQALRHFQSHWSRGDPVVVRGVREKYVGCWEPRSITRAMCSTTREENNEVKLMNCETGEDFIFGVNDFFKAFDSREWFERNIKEPRGHGMLKLRDWPTEDDFKGKLLATTSISFRCFRFRSTPT